MKNIPVLDMQSNARIMRQACAGLAIGVASLVLALPVRATTVLFDGGSGYATGILGLLVGGSSYNVEFVGGSYDDVFSLTAPAFLGDETTADMAANAIRDAMNAEPSVPTISAFDSEVLWVPAALIGGDFQAEQVGHDFSTAPWQRYGDFQGSRSTDWPAGGPGVGNGWYFARFSPATVPVPEPGTIALFAVGAVAGLGTRRRRRAAG